jgi:ubiquinone/menaquinone biosynthesis C-methylase UbiE
MKDKPTKFHGVPKPRDTRKPDLKPKTKSKDTSWGKVADWYDKHLQDENTYHSQVVLPNLVRVVDLKPNEAMLELGCGQGFFIEKFSKFSNKLTGVDLGKTLIEQAYFKKIPGAEFIWASADDENILKDKKFDVITVILALQNMKNIAAVVKNIKRLLKPEGRVYIVLNHPSFRIPQRSSWDMDKEKKIQYRRIDAYMSEFEAKIDMTPGKEFKKKFTLSYHRPLQVYMKAFAKEDLAIVRLEEWISHRKSEGAWAKAENVAKKEIPLFMCLVLKNIN